jgi:hypothetical protein
MPFSPSVVVLALLAPAEIQPLSDTACPTLLASLPSTACSIAWFSHADSEKALKPSADADDGSHIIHRDMSARPIHTGRRDASSRQLSLCLPFHRIRKMRRSVEDEDTGGRRRDLMQL